LGKDILGSVRSTSNDYGALEERYEYDAFGKPYKGDLSTGMNLGYTSKPYDTTTGMYNYGYRDYKPEVARFTTVDPVRDGSNWFAYVNNDPVNYLDPWGLSASDVSSGPVWPTTSTKITSTFGTDHPFGVDVGATTQGQKGDPIVTSIGGKVTEAGHPDWSGSGSSYVIIEGTDGRTYRYTHSENITVKTGDTVTTGQQISTMGKDGTKVVHLHFEVFEGGKRIDPLSLYPDTSFTLPSGSSTAATPSSPVRKGSPGAGNGPVPMAY
jgi:RHS repeat-associated protein